VRPLARLARVLVGLLKELADENAYERHLATRGCQHSAREWQRFHEARLRAKYERPKCC
jgi:hypothetical protein